MGDEQCEFYGGAVPPLGPAARSTANRPGVGLQRHQAIVAPRTIMWMFGEQCDDGAAVSIPFDGCFNCVAEPKCPAGRCRAVR